MPPNPVVVFDERGDQRNTFVGPYEEGAAVTLICDAFRGKEDSSQKRRRRQKLCRSCTAMLAANRGRRKKWMGCIQSCMWEEEKDSLLTGGKSRKACEIVGRQVGEISNPI